MKEQVLTDSKVISFLRFPLTFLVVMQHCKGEIPNNISWQELSWINIYYSVKIFFSGGISFIAVPAFFFISGYLFFRNVEEFGGEAYRGKLHKRARSLLVPYIIWITSVS